MEHRFVIRWNNGFYKVFDTEKYQDVPLARRLGNRKEAEAALDLVNGAEANPRINPQKKAA